MDDVTLYWRPGCGFCMALRNRLDQLGVAYSAVNIWDDAEAAATVRAANDGNELVPTVTVGQVTLSNPSAAAVVAAMGAGTTEPPR